MISMLPTRLRIKLSRRAATWSGWKNISSITSGAKPSRNASTRSRSDSPKRIASICPRWVVRATSTACSPSCQARGCSGSSGLRQISAIAERGTLPSPGSATWVEASSSTLANSLLGSTPIRRSPATIKPPGMTWLREDSSSAIAPGCSPSRRSSASRSAMVSWASALPASSMRDRPGRSDSARFRRSAASVSCNSDASPLTERTTAGMSICRSSSTMSPTASGNSRRARCMAWRTRSQAASVS